MSHIRIDVDDLFFGYEKENDILKGISFHARESESVGIIGENGAGKSTLLKLLVGLYGQYRGCIRIEDIPVEKSTLSVIRSRIGYVFQDSESQLFMNTVYEDIAFAPRNYGLPEQEVEKRVERALKMTGAERLKEKQIYKLSGGEKKLAAIATVLSMTPDILLMDEPSGALDPQNRRNLIRILNSFGHLKVIASHDLDMVLDTCQRAVLMYRGRIVKDGPAEEILTDRELLEAHGLELPLCLQGRSGGLRKT